MRKPRRRLASMLPAFALAAMHATAAQGPLALLHSLFDPATNAQVGARQGWSVAVDGNIAVVGAPYDDVGGQDSGLVKVYNAGTGALLHTLTNPRPAVGDNFGYAVAISGTRVVVGVGWDDTGAGDAGIAYVYNLASAAPAVPVATLTNPSPSASDLFGYAVAISGTRVVVGVPYDDTGAGDAGSAYVYDLAGGTPTIPVTTLNNPNPALGETFGRTVAIDGTRVVVGANRDATGALVTGSAYVFDLASPTPNAPVTTLDNPSPAPSDLFGYSVAISGTRVVVGARWDDAGATDAGSAYVYDLASATPAVPVATLTNPSPAASDRFGFAVAISGTRVMVGAPYDDTGAEDAGSAYVFDLGSVTPTAPVLTLTHPHPATSGIFGASVAISGTRAVIGAPFEGAVAPDPGAAYVYDLAGPMPGVPVNTLNNPSPVADELFGFSVALAGTWVVVGVPYDDTGALDAGIAYVYDYAGLTPTVPVLTLTNPHPVVSGYFGFSVAISGTRVVVGAIYDDHGPTYAGTGYVYDLAGATPALPIAKLTNPRPREADYFGSSVAISGARVVVGVPFDSTAAFNSGRAYVYDLAGATPGLAVLTLTNPSPAAEDYFGHAVAISGTRLVVGAFGDDTGAGNAGSAYVYDLSSAAPAAPVLTLTNPSPEVNDWFGSAVAISATRVVIGAYGDRTGGFYAGSAYVYDLAGGTPATPVLTLNNPNPSAGDSFGDAVAISGTRVAVGKQGADTGAPDAGSAYLYDLDSATPATPVATLTNPTPAHGDQFGNSLAIDGTNVVVGAAFVDGVSSDRGAAYVFGPRPTLRITRATPGLATISWAPATSTGLVLQYTDGLPSTNWLTASSGAVNPVTVPATNGSRFYRLFQP